MAPLGPEAGDQEQRVIDGHGEPDQDDELAGVRADRGDRLAVEREDPEGREERGHGEHERDERRDDRAERDQRVIDVDTMIRRAATCRGRC